MGTRQFTTGERRSAGPGGAECSATSGRRRAAARRRSSPPASSPVSSSPSSPPPSPQPLRPPPPPAPPSPPAPPAAAPAAAIDAPTRPDAHVTHGPSCRPGGLVVEVQAGTLPYFVRLATTRRPAGEDEVELAPGQSAVLRTGDVAWGETIDGRLEFTARDGSGAG